MRTEVYDRAVALLNWAIGRRSTQIVRSNCTILVDFLPKDKTGRSVES